MYFSAWAVREKPTKRAETGIEPGSRDPESNALYHSAFKKPLSEKKCLLVSVHKVRNHSQLMSAGHFDFRVFLPPSSSLPASHTHSSENARSFFFVLNSLAFLRVYGQLHERLCSLPVSVLFRVGSAGKNQPREQRRESNPARGIQSPTPYTTRPSKNPFQKKMSACVRA